MPGLPFIRPPVYPGTDIPAGNDPATGYDPNVYPGVLADLPQSADPGVTMDDLKAGASPTFDAKSTGGDVASWDHLMQLLTLGGNVYTASRTQPGSVPGTPDQMPNKTQATVTPRVGVETKPGVPTTGVNWAWIIVFLLIAGAIVWIVGRMGK